MVKSSILNALKLFKKADYFGVQLNFQFKDKEKYKSIYGELVFISYFVFSIFFIMINFLNFINRTTMNLVFKEGLREAAEINFNKFSVQYAIGLDSGNPEMMPTFYKYLEISLNAVTLKKVNGKTTKVKQSIALRNCEPEMFFGLISELYL